MTRSTKAPIYTLSKSRTEEHRRRERRKIKELLHTDPLSDKLLLDSRELGNDEWGTRMGFIPEGIDMSQEDIAKAKRK